jgi:alkanesulfonate monooxygenase SsuD/methylene tetrahydromethanopterin reductase-like flavin-dependent oxidoreductase (luciferase family)
MEAGLHLPQLELFDEGLSHRRLTDAVDAARECGFVAVSANDHFLFGAPWLDGLLALAAVVDRAGSMTLATTVSLPTLRGPVPLARAMLALHVLSGGRAVAGLGPGSSKLDYDAIGVPFEQRWERFDEAVALLRALLRGEEPLPVGRYYPAPDGLMSPLPLPSETIPLWIGSWGSAAGLRRVARLGDGWLASAYHTTPGGFAAGLDRLGRELQEQGRRPDTFPHALVTMWTWVTEDQHEAERIIEGRLAPLLHQDPAVLRGRICVGSPQMCAELLAQYATDVLPRVVS